MLASYVNKAGVCHRGVTWPTPAGLRLGKEVIRENHLISYGPPSIKALLGL